MPTDKIALITGGSRGLGKNMAIRLAEKGHDVIITYNSNKEAGDTVVAEIEAILASLWRHVILLTRCILKISGYGNCNSWQKWEESPIDYCRTLKCHWKQLS